MKLGEIVGLFRERLALITLWKIQKQCDREKSNTSARRISEEVFRLREK